MSQTGNAARLTAVDNTGSDDEIQQPERARVFMERLRKLGMHEMPRREGAKTLGISEPAWWNLRTGQGVYASTIAKAEAGLEAWLDEHGRDIEGEASGDEPGETFELSVRIGAIDVAVTAKGRPEDADMVREQVRQLVIDLMAQKD